MKVVLLGRDSPSTWMMVNALRPVYPKLLVALERRVAPVQFLKRRAAKVGAVKVTGQLLFMAYARVLRCFNWKRMAALIKAENLSDSKPLDLAVVRFDSVNSRECVEWLSNAAPDVVILNGTRIVSSEVLNASKAVFLNTHCGITPAYRGVHGAYWALHRGNTENVGVTVHVVDEGIDTGGIVYQAPIRVEAKDSFPVYPIKQYIAGIPLMLQALSDIQAGRLKVTQRNDLESAIWQHPTIWEYLAARWLRGVR